MTCWPDFRHSRRALAEYDRMAPERMKVLDTDPTGKTWMQVEDAAIDGVREAFFLDTADRNSWDHAMAVDLGTMRRWHNHQKPCHW